MISIYMRKLGNHFNFWTNKKMIVYGDVLVKSEEELPNFRNGCSTIVHIFVAMPEMNSSFFKVRDSDM